jgi:hypothetical protein
MTTAQRAVVSTLAIALAAWTGLRAQEQPGPRRTGRVLILQNEHALEGDIERSGDQYHIRRPAGELWIPVENVLCLCASWEDAFRLLSRQANLHDPDERVRLARWCEYNGLHAQALTEAAAAVRLRPEHAAAKQLLARLQQRNAEAGKKPAPAQSAPGEGTEAAVSAVDLCSESMAAFTTRVHPILMNTCATCHATGHGGNFRLTRCTDATLNRRGLHQNLAAVLAQVDLEHPALSPLLYKAVSPHGGAQHAPVAGRQSVPFQTLAGWVEMTLATNPHLARAMGRAPREPPALGQSARKPAGEPVGTVSGPRLVSQERPGAAAQVSFAVPPPESLPASVPAAATPLGPPPQAEQAELKGPWAPRDFCDPEIFNRMRSPQP